ncbi:MAG TPA: TetR/AcrR family transcriptional regulator [Rhizomicrobium sp.]|nr:TetR/AcrR family transcriptional regulator [Rhizomicrobium sp.]
MTRKTTPKTAPGGAQSSKQTEGWVLPAHQSRSREQRDRLLKAGERVFASQGFWESHVSEIVKEADCSVGSFYRRFRDKEALFLALQQDMHARSHANIDRFFANPIGEQRSLTSIFFHLIDNTGSEAIKIKGYYRALFEISLRGRNVWSRMRELEEYQARCFEKLLRKRGVKNIGPDFVPSLASAIRMMTGSQISIMLHGPGPYNFNDPELTAQLTRSLMAIAGVPVDEDELEKLVASRKSSRRKK